MKPISVEKAGLVDDFAAWGVAPNYARFFLAKCREENGLIMLEPFVFNDSIHMTNRHQWFVANAAFWCRVYREAESSREQGEAIASIRAIFYVAGMLGQGEVTAMIMQWWAITAEIHGLPSLNATPTIKHHSTFSGPEWLWFDPAELTKH
ncbi:hypothetical protein [Serratia rhizosphaerae]